MQKQTRVYIYLLICFLLFIGPQNITSEALAQENTEAIEQNPIWSPLGDQIGFASINMDDYLASQGRSLDEYNYDIWVMNADGSNKVNLTAESAFRSTAPDQILAELPASVPPPRAFFDPCSAPV